MTIQKTLRKSLENPFTNFILLRYLEFYVILFFIIGICVWWKEEDRKMERKKFRIYLLILFVWRIFLKFFFSKYNFYLAKKGKIHQISPFKKALKMDIHPQNYPKWLWTAKMLSIRSLKTTFFKLIKFWKKMNLIFIIFA